MRWFKILFYIEQMFIHADGGPYAHYDYSYSLIKRQKVYKTLISDKVVGSLPKNVSLLNWYYIE